MSSNEDPTKHPDHPKQQFMRFGAPTGRFEDGYSDVPECGERNEPEALDKQDLRIWIQPQSINEAKIAKAQEDKEAKRLTLAQRADQAYALAKERRLDISREWWVLQQMFARGESTEKLTKKVQELEALVHWGRQVAA